MPLGYAGPFDETSLDQALVIARLAVSTTAAGRVAGGTSRRFATASSSATSGVATLTNALGGFMGSGNADIFFATESLVGATVSGANFVLEVITEASVSMTVTYDYDSPSLLSFSAEVDVPEPASLLVFAAGLAGLGITRRRRH